MIDEPSWILEKERPAAIIYAIVKKTGSKNINLISEYLKKLSSNNSWIGKISLFLYLNQKEIKEIIDEIDFGLMPSNEISKQVLNVIERSC
ncbi:MAG: hypothetical protein ACP5I6_03980 [Caldisphaera sp.]|jgi:hypothetical protein|nr:hypothetical protein [Caldisphaera sp.]PMP61159.1 MAG: hypothetical protein C0201_00460 [Caldisphaera sp.]